MRVVLAAALAAAALYGALAAAGDLTHRVPLYLAAHALLVGAMLLAHRAVARGGRAAFRAMLAAAVVFRLIALAAPPSLSDDVYRYVWDGRVQAAGHHPYKFAPSDPMRAELRDGAVYPRINHPEIPTIYPPLAELLFAALALAKLGVGGFKLAFVALDVGVIVALLRLLRALELPRDRIVFYAWNPLAVVEVAASGHLEPAGILPMVLALAWLIEERPVRAGAALGAAIQMKLLPLILFPGFVRRLKLLPLLAMLAVVVLTTVPYAVRGPFYGRGVLAYAHRWEHGAVLFEGVRAVYARIDLAPGLKAGIAWAQARWGAGDTALWDALYRAVWPQELARATVAALALMWAAAQSFRPRIDAAHEARLALGGAILLAPTLHPWYVLWILPLAACALSGGWLLFAGLIPLQYLAGRGEVPWGIRLAILLPSAAWMLRDTLRSRR
ncbi:MAG TPA: glycosyltransferase 87 family protein [Candidatus Polarisedimenticolaceae bacterium]|nr:glycosyltransferase 87 family protein [Candidatus Polarisedimenticolaceae bacterium]